MISRDFFSIKVERNPSTLSDDDQPPKPTVLGVKESMGVNDRYVEMLEQIAIAAWHYVRAPNNRSRINELLRGLARWDSVYGWDGEWQNDQPEPKKRRIRKSKTIDQ